MPSIIDASSPVTEFPNQFVSPYGNDRLVPLYASLPLFGVKDGCLPCVVCGNSIVRNEVILNSSTQGSSFGATTVTLAPTHP